jgi:uncharacterized membrane protein
VCIIFDELTFTPPCVANGRFRGLEQPMQTVVGARLSLLDMLSRPEYLAVLLVAVLVILLLVAYYLVRKLRDHIGQEEAGTAEVLSNFEEIHQRGTLSDEEYRTIKTALSGKLLQELKDKGETT